MPDNFSLDDILAEIDAKKSGDKPKSPSMSKKTDFSVTSIINSEELRAAANKPAEKKPAKRPAPRSSASAPKEDYSVTAIINSDELKKADRPSETPKKTIFGGAKTRKNGTETNCSQANTGPQA